MKKLYLFSIATILGILFAIGLVKASEATFIAITSPAEGNQVNGLVSINAEASSSSGIQLVDFRVDGQGIGTDSAYPYSVSWDTSSLLAGSWHQLIAIVYDYLGIGTSSSPVNVQIAPLPTPTPTPTPTPAPTPIPVPTISITSPLDGSTVKRGTVVTITADAQDTEGINKVEFYVNNSLTCTDTESSYTCNWKVPKIYKTTYTLTAKAYNLAGNAASSSIRVNSR